MKESGIYGTLYGDIAKLANGSIYAVYQMSNAVPMHRRLQIATGARKS